MSVPKARVLPHLRYDFESPRATTAAGALTRPPETSRAAGRRARTRGGRPRGRRRRGFPSAPARSTRRGRTRRARPRRTASRGSRGAPRAAVRSGCPGARRGSASRRTRATGAVARMSFTSRKCTVSAARKRPRPARKTPSRRNSGTAWTSGHPTRHRGTEQARRPERQPRAEDGQREEEVDPLRRDRDERQDLGREEDLLQESAVRRERRRGVREAAREPVPRQEAREEEERVGARRRAPSGEDEREDDGVDREHEERVQERPEEPEDAPAVARLELPRDEDEGQRAVAPEPGQVLQHAASIPKHR